MAVILGIIKIYSDDEFPRFLFGVFWNDVKKKVRSGKGPRLLLKRKKNDC